MSAGITGLDSLTGLSAEFEKRVNTLATKMLGVLREELDKSVEDIWNDIAKDQETMITQFFNEAVTSFYEDLPQEEITYQRAGDTASKSGGLYNALVLPRGEHGLIEYDTMGTNDYSNLFDGSRMTINIHPKRTTIESERGLRQTLFAQAFYGGWHGGASKISQGKAEQWGDHPAPGTPYYRAPGLVRSKHGGMTWHRFGKWGERAKKSDTAPYELFYENMIAYDASLQERYQKMADIRASEAVNRAASKLPTIYADIFGN